MYLLRCHSCWHRYAETTLDQGCTCGGRRYSPVNPTKFNLFLFLLTDFKRHWRLVI